jgi:hypothetical protein
VTRARGSGAQGCPMFSWSTIISGSDFQKSAKAVQASHDKSRIQQDHKPNSACIFLIFETSFHGRIAGGQMVPRSRSRGILKAGRRRLTRRELGKDITSASRVLHNLNCGGVSGQITVNCWPARVNPSFPWLFSSKT